MTICNLIAVGLQYYIFFLVSEGVFRCKAFQYDRLTDAKNTSACDMLLYESFVTSLFVRYCKRRGKEYFQDIEFFISIVSVWIFHFCVWRSCTRLCIKFLFISATSWFICTYFIIAILITCKQPPTTNPKNSPLARYSVSFPDLYYPQSPLLPRRSFGEEFPHLPPQAPVFPDTRNCGSDLTPRGGGGGICSYASHQPSPPPSPVQGKPPKPLPRLSLIRRKEEAGPLLGRTQSEVALNVAVSPGFWLMICWLTDLQFIVCLMAM